MRIPGNGRPLNRAVREITDAREREEMRQMMKQTELSTLAEQMMQAMHAGNQEQLMSVWARLMSTIQSHNQDSILQMSADPRTLKRDQFTNMAYQNAGVQIIDGNIWDFDALLQYFVRIEFFDDEHEGTIVEMVDGNQFTMSPLVSNAFKRYLHYVGIYAVEAAKLPCPECAGKEPTACDTCAGLGWIVREDLEFYGSTTVPAVVADAEEV